MSIEIVLEGQLETEKDFEGYVGLIKELCTVWKLKIETFENFALIDVCPEGFIEVTYEDTFLSISAQTNVAGPGFHAYVCDFFEAIKAKSPIELSVSDPTNYYMQRNFAQLKVQVFYRWLKDIAAYIKEAKNEVESLCISWPMDYYQPKPKAGYVVTPMGYIAESDFEHQDVETLADRFFIWNQQGRDAHYYRNAALNLMWKECFFEYTNMNEYTEKQADTIIDYLELAYEKDPDLPLPLDEYEFLCNIKGRNPKIVAGKRLITLQEIGYRKEMIELHFGNWSIPVNGCAEKSVDEANQTLYLMSPYQDAGEPWRWMYRVNVYAFKQEVGTFLPEFTEDETAFTFTHDEVHGVYRIEQQEDHYVVSAQLNCRTEMMLIQIVICHKEDIQKLLERIKQIKCRQIKDNNLKA